MYIIYTNENEEFVPINKLQTIKKIDKIIKVPLLSPEEIKEDFSYPFGCISKKDYHIENFYNETIYSEIDVKYAKNFHENITQIYFYDYDDRDDDDNTWELIGKLSNDYYFYYSAGCDYTGFECRGEMSLYLNSTLCNLLNYNVEQNILQYMIFDHNILHEKITPAIIKIQNLWRYKYYDLLDRNGVSKFCKYSMKKDMEDNIAISNKKDMEDNIAISNKKDMENNIAISNKKDMENNIAISSNVIEI